MNSERPYDVRDVPRYRHLDPDSLQKEHFDRGVPCVLAGFHRSDELEDWKERLAASEEKVLAVVARTRNISKISDAERPPVEKAAEYPELNEFVAELSLAEAWGRVSDPEAHDPILASGETVYLIEAELPESLLFPRRLSGDEPSADEPVASEPVASESVDSEQAVDADGEASEDPMRALVWSDPRAPQTILSMPGTINRNHTHVHEVLLHQIHGRKSVRLFSPADTAYLYMNDERRSEVLDYDQPDVDRYPLIRRASAWETVLDPGDVLFLPSYWWHEIRVAEPSISLGYPVQAGFWAQSMFRLHHEMADQLERCAADPVFDASTARGAMAIVATATGAGLGEVSLDEVVAGLRYDYE